MYAKHAATNPAAFTLDYPTTSTPAFGRLGKNSQVSYPLLITNPGRIFIGENVCIRDGSRLEAISEYAGTVYHPTLLIEKGVSIEFSAHIGAACFIRIGKNTMIAGRVTILDHDHGYQDATMPPLRQPLMVGAVDIDDDVWLGENVCVCKGVRIGKHAVIGANSLVTADIPSFSVASGNPAKVIKLYNFQTKEWQKVSDKTIQEALQERAAFATQAYEHAQKLVVQNDHEAAIDVLKTLVNFCKEHALAHNDLGVLFYQAGELQKAGCHYEEAVRLQPENVTFLKNLAEFYTVVKGNIVEALTLYQKVISLQPEDKEAWTPSGRSLRHSALRRRPPSFSVSRYRWTWYPAVEDSLRKPVLTLRCRQSLLLNSPVRSSSDESVPLTNMSHIPPPCFPCLRSGSK